MKKTLLVIVLIILVALFYTGDEAVKNDKPTIVTSTFALYDVASHIVGENMNVTQIVPFGVDIHHFEPTPKDIVTLKKSSLFIFSGAGLEPWTKNFISTNSSINMSKYVKLEGNEHQCSSSHEHEHKSVDPHYWLDIHNMKIASQEIFNSLVLIDEKNRNFYEKNLKNYMKSLDELNATYKKSLKSCKVNKIVVNHNAFEYLAHEYNFEIIALSGFSSDSQPSAASMARLIELVKNEKIMTIFFESFVSDKTMQTISQESGAKVDFLEPIANITPKQAKHKVTFIDLMRENLHKLSSAMECK
ncbi:MAG: zinc ABC transporter solute-binding protein [Helicobacteraceae bacterium]|nr:zinc ABC transporter solute-binding protein [Helicobacteraceae bacterium]